MTLTTINRNFVIRLWMKFDCYAGPFGIGLAPPISFPLASKSLLLANSTHAKPSFNTAAFLGQAEVRGYTSASLWVMTCRERASA